MATSNVTGAIDLAFVDRADIKQYIGPPPVKGIYKILTSCIVELIRVSVVYAHTVFMFYSGTEKCNHLQFLTFHRQILSHP